MIHGARVVHHIPGRLRVRLPRERRDAQRMRELCDFVQGLGGVHDVEINPATGSVLVHYDPAAHENATALLRSAADAVPPEFGEAGQLAEQVEREMQFLAAHSEVALGVVKAARRLDREIRIASGNTLDLKVLVPGAMAVAALCTVGSELAMPLWVGLGIYSFNSFVALHHPSTLPPPR